MNVGQLIEVLGQYPKNMTVASFDTSRTYGPIMVTEDRDAETDDPFDWVVICCPDWLGEIKEDDNDTEV
ncbi:hypothetical protein ACTXNW_14365 [Enterococcus malodoratus]|uniref:hypothetical protein n=1 Tax=Enterococcus malodoratus TaxID=71451 RepID=UPI0039B0D8FC